MTLTATDLFCGAGGSSEGARMAGVRLAMAANHWPRAIEVHQANFPDAAHDCADVSQVDPRRYPPTDILIASPECTSHSSAKGVSRRKQDPDLFDSPDPGAERSRATMWDVHRFTEVHGYAAVLVENVVDVARWTYWRSWLRAWDDAGYDVQVLNINSAHTGAVPQWRDRVYVVAYRCGIDMPDLTPRPPSWCPACERTVEGVQSFRRPGRRVGKWRMQYDYRCPTCAGVVDPPAPPAADIIDWTLPGERIGDRKRPLAPATRRRIRIGLERYGVTLYQSAGNTYERPGSGYARAWPLGQPAPTQTCDRQHSLAWPPGLLVQPHHEGADESRVRGLEHPCWTVTARRDVPALVVPLRRNGRARPSAEPVGTITAGGNHHGLLMAPQSGGQAMPTDRPAPSVVTRASALLVTYNRTGTARPITEPTTTVTTRDTHALVEPAPDVDDCLFRMLSPDESGRAMAFPDDYRVEGTITERQRLYGNAVTPPVVHVLAGQVVACLEEVGA